MVTECAGAHGQGGGEANRGVTQREQRALASTDVRSVAWDCFTKWTDGRTTRGPRLD